jgi:Flp pilus assembly protein TadG
VSLIRRSARSLRDDRSGLALIEFGIALPVLLAVGGYGAELSFLALTNLKVSQYALNLADNGSRVGLLAGNGVTQLREADVNDILSGAKIQGQAINLTTYGRITLSSLENVKQSYDTNYVQRIHWQRCLGKMSGMDPNTSLWNYDSNYGTTPKTAGSDASQGNAGTITSAGMGDANTKVSASPGSAVIFVEVNYKYQPLFGNLFVKAPVIHYAASFVVRDNRDFSQIFNPSPAAAQSTCDRHDLY